MRNKIMLPAIACGSLLTAATAFAGNGDPINTGTGNALTIAAYGDAPYGLNPTDMQQFEATPAFIAAINADPMVDLVMHVGDIHSGKSYCTEAYDRGVFGLWTGFKDPLSYTPGDNEWTDCHKAAEGGGLVDANGNPVDYAGGNPVANLDLIRSIFFSEPGVLLGGRKKQVVSQAQSFDPAYPSDAKFVENVMWEQSGVVFVTINLPGGSNNDNDIWFGAKVMTAEQQTEIAERTAADLRWLDEAYQLASDTGASAMLIQAQADMWDPEKGAAHQAQFEPFIAKIAAKTLAFGKPVLMLNGDSHVYQSNNPLDPSDAAFFMHPYYNVPNFHRVVVHGSTIPLEYMRLTIDPQTNAANGANAFGPFSWTQVTP